MAKRSLLTESASLVALFQGPRNRCARCQPVPLSGHCDSMGLLKQADDAALPEGRGPEQCSARAGNDAVLAEA